MCTNVYLLYVARLYRVVYQMFVNQNSFTQPILEVLQQSANCLCQPVPTHLYTKRTVIVSVKVLSSSSVTIYLTYCTTYTYYIFVIY